MRTLSAYFSSLVLGALIFAQLGCVLKGLPVVNSAVKKWDEADKRAQDEFIEKTPDFRLLRDACEDKRPLDFELLERSVMDRESPLIEYYYVSKIQKDEGFKRFRLIFDSSWTEVENLSINPTIAFQRGNVRAIVQYGGIRDADWSVSCVIKSPGAR